MSEHRSRAQQSLPPGWTLRVYDGRCGQLWVTLVGPEGQAAAFGCDADGIRAEILRQYMDARRAEIPA